MYYTKHQKKNFTTIWTVNFCEWLLFFIEEMEIPAHWGAFFYFVSNFIYFYRVESFND